MRMEWSDDGLMALWTLVGEDWSLVGTRPARLGGGAVLLKFFEIEARFPRRLTCSRLDQECVDRLEALLVDESGSGRGGLLAELKADPGQGGLDLRVAPRPVRLTLLAALCWVRAAEITDALVDLLIGLIHWIAHASNPPQCADKACSCPPHRVPIEKRDPTRLGLARQRALRASDAKRLPVPPVAPQSAWCHRSPLGNVSVGCREPARGSVPGVNTATMGRTTLRRT
jgi:hypothetical protein